jgi:hypothetical protein
VIGWYVHHVGLGHATRAGAVARRLGTPVTGLGSGSPPRGWRGDWLPLERDDRAPRPGADDDVTAHGTLHWVPRHHPGLARRHARLAAWACAERPALLVVDVSVEVTLLARLCGVPVVVVALPGRRADRAHEVAYDVADALLAPWPSGTHETAWPERWTAKTWCVGGISRFDERTVPPPPTTRRHGERTVLVLWGAGGRDTPATDLDRARAATPGWRWVERGPGCPGDLWPELAAADVVVTHGGQNAVAEVASARRPAVVVAQPRPFEEQVATARAVDALGVAVGLDHWPAPERWPSLLETAAARGGSGWARWTSGDGARSAAHHLEDLLDRNPRGRSTTP